MKHRPEQSQSRKPSNYSHCSNWKVDEHHSHKSQRAGSSSLGNTSSAPPHETSAAPGPPSSQTRFLLRMGLHHQSLGEKQPKPCSLGQQSQQGMRLVVTCTLTAWAGVNNSRDLLQETPNWTRRKHNSKSENSLYAQAGQGCLHGLPNEQQQTLL